MPADSTEICSGGTLESPENMGTGCCAQFGAPSNRFMDTVGAPQVVIGPLYQPKTLELCATDDPVCSDGGDWAAHGSYADDGMVDQGASIAAGHL